MQQLRLVIRSDTAIGGLDQYVDSLKKWNEQGVIDFKAYDVAWPVTKSDISPGQFYHDSLNIERHDNATILKFRSDSLHFELTGTNVISIDDYTYCAIYGTLYDNRDLFTIQGSTSEEIANSLLALKGSFSIICVSFRFSSVYLLKDEIGMKSLLANFEACQITIATCATSVEQQWYELPPFFCAVITNEINTIERCNLALLQICKQQRLTQDIRLDQVEMAIMSIREALCEAVKDACSPRIVKECVTILFSGGIDSAILASMVAENVTDLQYVELVNVAFQPKRAPDRITAMCTYEDLLHLYPNVEFRLICVDVDTDEYKEMEPHLFELIFPNLTHMDLNIAAALHYAAKRTGYILNPQVLKTPQWQKIRQSVSIMKSVNLRVNIVKPPQSHLTSPENIHGCNINLESLVVDQISNSASDDEEKLLALYDVRATETHSNMPYISTSNVVIIGSGADEIFGGYGRHSVERKVDASISEHEINRDLLRLWKRNMGRDDRVLNDLGISAIYPFLHQHVLTTLTQLNMNPAISIDALACPEWFKSLGVYKTMKFETLKYNEFLSGAHNKHVAIYMNKWLLREIAHRIGLNYCVHFKKRAIQFGSRSANTFNMLRGMSNRVASDKGAAVLQRCNL
ncbi:putative asparagine synthase [Babesia divergens]|uniref:Asparagine synthase n=1 Tax=Babesia divergens TaxID=32595 RepID=A0AAD9GAE5_BABDI|nr:putative asparagine synthase [Babesia divergens]